MNALLLLPLLPLLGSLLGFILQTRPRAAVVCTTGLVALLFISVILFSSPLFVRGHFELTIIQGSGFPIVIALLFDHLTEMMLLLITFMSLIIHFFSARYMLSDMAQARFMAQLSLLTFAVVTLVMSGNLLTAFIAWQWIGLSLYLLLNHYHYDLNANKAAKKKFIINRLGDVCFLLAVILAYHVYGTSNYIQLFSANNVSLPWLGQMWSTKAIIIGLIFVAIMTKSAQFPFHIWLPDTMETPTPVSAIMHAGIINAGGFLLARLSPLVVQSPAVVLGIFWVGLITMLSASFFVLTQTDVKKQLAYSTMGQMGYMTLQCGLGCFPAAIFHLITHGFFKASLFLNSGNALAYPENIYKEPNQIAARVKKTFITLAISLLIMALGIHWLSIIHHDMRLNNLLLIFISITIAQTVWQVLGSRSAIQSKFGILIFLTIILLIYLFFINGFEVFLQSSIVNTYKSVPLWQYCIAGFLVILQLITWVDLPQRWRKTIFSKRLYVLSLNKAYIELFYRHYLLNPLRKIGDIGNGLFKHYLASKALLPAIFMFLLFMFGYGTYEWWQRELIAHDLLLLTNILFFIIFLIIANRTELFNRLFLFLIIIELSFVNIGLFANDLLAATWAMFHLVNVMVLLLSLIMLLIQHRGQATLSLVEKNILPWQSLYLSVVLLLLIGIPGTASFITEFFILYALLQMSPLLAIGLGIGIVLLAIVVLHLLQLYVFNPAKFSQKNLQLPIFVHAVCILSILFNILNGIFPGALFHVLNHLKG